jgi:hypothetical protein
MSTPYASSSTLGGRNRNGGDSDHIPMPVTSVCGRVDPESRRQRHDRKTHAISVSPRDVRTIIHRSSQHRRYHRYQPRPKLNDLAPEDVG